MDGESLHRTSHRCFILFLLKSNRTRYLSAPTMAKRERSICTVRSLVCRACMRPTTVIISGVRRRTRSGHTSRCMWTAAISQAGLKAWSRLRFTLVGTVRVPNKGSPSTLPVVPGSRWQRNGQRSRCTIDNAAGRYDDMMA